MQLTTTIEMYHDSKFVHEQGYSVTMTCNVGVQASENNDLPPGRNDKRGAQGLHAAVAGQRRLGTRLYPFPIMSTFGLKRQINSTAKNYIS